MPRIGPDTFKRLQKDPTSIRNICIVAHVDHGKTSLSDSLLASNGIISQRLAGKIRYLDSRPDEQIRGITMESSAISLYFRVLHKQDGQIDPLVNEYLINLIDSPGHIDFSSEVSAASRLCDGAVVLVDVVEGVCSQTITVLRQCWVEKLKPVLVLNKIDRLITELKLTPQEAYLHLSRVIEQVNSIIGSFFAGERQLNDLTWREQLEQNASAEYVEKDDSGLYFDPCDNNVVFASAIDGWGFNIGQLAKFYSEKLGAKRENLMKVLWGDFYMDPKTKKIINSKGLKGRNLKPLFVSLILENIWKIYENVLLQRNMDMVDKIVKALDIKLLPRDLRTKDDRQFLRTIIGQWLPVSTAVLLTVIEKLPSPKESQKERLDLILGGKETENEIDGKLLEAVRDCDETGPSIAYVSKILSIPREDLPTETLSSALSTEERARQEAMNAAKRAEMVEQLSKLGIEGEKKQDLIEGTDDTGKLKGRRKKQGRKNEDDDEFDLYRRVKETAIPDMDSSGELKESNDQIQIVSSLAPEFDPGFEFEGGFNDGTANAGDEGTSGIDSMAGFTPAPLDPNDPLNALFSYEDETAFQIGSTNTQSTLANELSAGVVSETKATQEDEQEEEDIFDETDEVLIGFARIYSGCLKVGQEITVLQPKYDPREPTKHIKTATITSMYLFMGKELVPLESCPAGNIVGIGGLAGKLLKNGTLVEKGTKGANLAGINLHTTPIVRVAVEPVNPTEMNKLVRGLKLLEQADPCVRTYINNSGEHILCTAGELHLERCLKDLRERFAGIEITRSEPVIPYRETFLSTSDMNPPKNSDFGRGVVVSTLGRFMIKMRTIPLSDEVTNFLDRNHSSMRYILGGDEKNLDSELNDDALETAFLDRDTFLERLKEHMKNDPKHGEFFIEHISDIAAFGPKRYGCNILMSKNNLLGHIFGGDTNGDVFKYADSVINGFQLSVNEGPLANEPVQGMCVFVEDIHEMDESELAEITDPTYQKEVPNISGRFITHSRDQIHESFLDWSPRIMWAIYSCEIQSSVEVIGKVYAVVQQRHGKIVSEEMKEGMPFFNIVAHIPVVEAFGLSEAIRKKTSGGAQPQLVFGGYECIDLDPFWVPTTEEELEELGDTADKENIARRHMNAIRKRKGLFVDEKVIENAEKQRTLKKD